MESHSPSYPNSQTPGKFYRSLKNLRKSDPSAQKFTEITPDLSKYIEILNSKGLQIHPNLALATFRTRNLLPYTGIISTNCLPPNEILLKIPRNLLLTTKTAYFSELNVIFNENPEFYSRYVDKNWEDNILLTFLLHEYQKKEKSYWHFLLKLLPKDIDYLAFWSEKELDLLEDPLLKAKAKRLLQEFDDIYKKLSEILDKYPEVFIKETYSYEIVKWIHIHLITRSFGGKYLNYVTMVPFAEFFNHECTNVYYDFIQNGVDGEKEQENNKEEERCDEKWEDNLSTSNESNKSEESEREEDFADIKGNFFLEDGQNEPILDKKLIENEEFASLFREVIEWIFNTIDLGDMVSCFYFNEILKKLTELKKKCLKCINKKMKQEINKSFTDLQVFNLKYKYHLLQYMTEEKRLDIDSLPVLSQKKIFSILDKPNDLTSYIERLKSKNFADQKLWKDDDFEYMILKNSEKDFFQKNSQVYFCYGRLSNRKLLSRYGMALEFNKYDNAIIKIGLMDVINTANKDFINYLNNFKLKKVRSFKLRPTAFNLDFLLFSRGVNWQIDKNTIEELFEPLNLDLELKALTFMQNIVDKVLKEEFKTDFEENAKLVCLEKFNYHEHFAIIYRLERQRILVLHEKIIKVAIEILKRLKKGVKIEEARGRVEEIEKSEEWQRNRWLLKGYLEKFVEKL